MDGTERAQALGQYVAGQLGASEFRVLEFVRLSGGAIQDNHALTLELIGGTAPGVHALVARSDAPSRLPFSLPRAAEFEVIRLAHETGVRTPQPLWACRDPSVIGTPFTIMARVAGSADPREWLNGALSESQARELTRQLGRELATLHQIRPPQPRLDFLEVPRDSPALQRIQGYRAVLDQIPDAHPVLEWGLNWLSRHAPEPGPMVLCHGDFRSGNFLVDDGRLTAILDWEFAAWGDALEDLGWLCSPSWRFGHPDKEVGGVGDKADLLDGYAETKGQTPLAEALPYWEIMATVRWGIIALLQAQRHLSGAQPSLELALTGRLLPEIELVLLGQIEETGELS